jgi:hypothetical protein
MNPRYKMETTLRIGDEIEVKGKIEEIIQTKDGYKLKVRFPQAETMFSVIYISSLIKEV